MAANKFATMLSRNTHKITVILVYAVLEWILIFLLLANSLFSYLIAKFANYFGLKPPCLWCSRVDHVFEPGKRCSFYRDLVCESHASEISKLGYCSNHRKLAEAQQMCEECSSSRPNCHGKSIDIGRRIAFFSWLKDMDVISSDGEKKVENGEKISRCSCCDVSMSGKLYSPYLLFQPSWGVLDYAQKGNLITAANGEDHDGGEYSDPCKSDCQTDRCCDDEHDRGEREDDGRLDDEHRLLSDLDEVVERREKELEEDCLRSPSSIRIEEIVGYEDEKVGAVRIKEQEPPEDENSSMCVEGINAVLQSSDDIIFEARHREDASIEIISLRLENINDIDDHRLVPIELIDSMTDDNQTLYGYKEEDQNKHDHPEGLLDTELPIETQTESVVDKEDIIAEESAVLLAEGSEEKTSPMELQSMKLAEIENCSALNIDECQGDLVGEVCEQVTIAREVKEPIDIPASEETSSKLLDNGTISEIPIETDMPDQQPNDLPQVHEPVTIIPCLPEEHFSNNYSNAGNSAISDTLMADDGQDSKQAEEATIESKTISVDRTEQGINHHLSLSLELNEVEEEKAPETPGYVEGIHQIHKKLLLLEKKESGTEDSLDGSVNSDFEIGEGVLTVERLKTALKAERRVLKTLYAELEEERSASAIAANQTMAMITRLQEEKAAMQMEALQYQRMMEEQSEYDQEALQLLNELMVKREKEKQDLEKELEVYRKKVLDYEAKEKRRLRRKDSSGRSRASSFSSSNAEDSDDLSIDHHGIRDEYSCLYGHQESSNNCTPVDAVLDLEDVGIECAKHLSTLDESLAEFEEERLLILEQLKVLEEKLFALADEEEEFFEDVKLIDHFPKENGKELNVNSDVSNEEVNRLENGFFEEFDTKYYQERRDIGSKAKTLLPLFDAISIENEDGIMDEEQGGSDSIVLQTSSSAKLALENKKHAIEEEVENVYERLQALEADREFLKHCISSLKKGDKGMHLLQEILQHLRDLRTVELRVRNMGDSAVA
ncbi:PREDICTED: myosin-binding protein 2 [Nelumbo nucifera]|uniref:Myosin-binding protein 2 n=1 Tax=Nelumbo nucifera TaxID=4432 RepID=A0A1U8AIE8_NELNU|nr:PREDICTED: myosin-binding protein 2 [Nelumbo nucifera]XP_010265710.1 PREDICTED: myosin-binding protein 2 [Nelumbo nucifera]